MGIETGDEGQPWSGLLPGRAVVLLEGMAQQGLGSMNKPWSALGLISYLAFAGGDSHLQAGCSCWMLCWHTLLESSESS